MNAALALFFVLLLGFAALLEWVIVTFGFNGMTVTLLMWSVGVAAMLALKLTGRDLSSLGWKWGSARHHLIAFALPIAYGGVAYASANAAGLADFPKFETIIEIANRQGFSSLGPALSTALLLFLALTAGLINNMASALGEEIGWRGFLTPPLTALLGFFGATLITGLLWASWHLPILIFSDYNAGGERLYEIISFVVMITAISGAFAWLRLDSGSLWPAATLHASHNLMLQAIFDPMTSRGDSPITMVGEFGVVTAGVCVLACLPFWIAGMRSGRNKVPAA
jgi:membrane protease YdiL (CAAX protease family)